MDEMKVEQITEKCIQLLIELIKTPSLSRDEAQAASVIRRFLDSNEISYEVKLNNTLCRNRFWDDSKPVVLLNSHIDTVKPVDGWTVDPFGALLEGDKLTGLGSNDAGGPLVSLLATFMYYYNDPQLPFNLFFAATAEEESSGQNGVAILQDEFANVDFALVGEPTQMQLAVAEKGLVVFDCVAHGKAGHAARNEGVNAIYLAMADIDKVTRFQFDRISPLLGAVKMTVTQIEAGFQHNVVPDTCKFVMDVRTNECYKNEEIVEIVNNLLQADATPRSLRLNSSGISLDHPFVKRAQELNIECYGSPTLSDQSLMTCQSVKMGPGDSARSHTANEFIYLSEIREGIRTYIRMLDGLQLK